MAVHLITGESLPRKIVLPEPPPPEDPVEFIEWLADRGEKRYDATMALVWSPKNNAGQIAGPVPQDAKYGATW